jgi:hypothetical protein
MKEKLKIRKLYGRLANQKESRTKPSSISGKLIIGKLF